MAAPAIFTALLFLYPPVSCAAVTETVSVTAAVLSKSVSRLDTKTLTLNFGTVDPGSPADASGTGAVGFRCGGSASNAAFAIIHYGGLHSAGPGSPRIQNGALPSEYLPYTLALTPGNGTVPRNTNQTLAITGTIRRADFQDASAGMYTDTVVISILPLRRPARIPVKAVRSRDR